MIYNLIHAIIPKSAHYGCWSCAIPCVEKGNNKEPKDRESPIKELTEVSINCGGIAHVLDATSLMTKIRDTEVEYTDTLLTPENSTILP